MPVPRLFRLLAAVLLAAMAPLASAQNAICYNCPPEWADWGTQLKMIKEKTGITVPQDNKNSGQSLSQLVAEKASPVADITYLGVTFGIQAKKEGVVTPYKPAFWNEIPDGLKDPDGYWFTIHSGTLGFMVNVDALKGKAIPKSWKDLQKPEYKGLIGYLDPPSAFVGYVGAVAVNMAFGGNMDDSPRRSITSRNCRRTTPSCRNRPRTHASCRGKSRSCSTTTSMPIAPGTRTKPISHLSSPPKAP